MSAQDHTDRDEREGPVRASAPEEILSTPPPVDLGAVLAGRPRPRGIPMSTAALAVTVLLAVGFVGGLLVGRHTASGSQTLAAGGLPGGLPTPIGAAGAGANGIAAGTVTRVEGDILYLKTADGSTVKVDTTDDTQIRISREGTLDDLSNGSTVVVQGNSTGQGVLEAARITEGDLGPGGPAGVSSPASGGSAGTG